MTFLKTMFLLCQITLKRYIPHTFYIKKPTLFLFTEKKYYFSALKSIESFNL